MEMNSSEARSVSKVEVEGDVPGCVSSLQSTL